MERREESDEAEMRVLVTGFGVSTPPPAAVGEAPGGRAREGAN